MGLCGLICPECKVCEFSFVLKYSQSCSFRVAPLRYELFDDVLEMIVRLDTSTNSKTKLTMFGKTSVAAFCFWDFEPVNEALDNTGDIKRLVPVSS